MSALWRAVLLVMKKHEIKNKIVYVSRKIAGWSALSFIGRVHFFSAQRKSELIVIILKGRLTYGQITKDCGCRY